VHARATEHGRRQPLQPFRSDFRLEGHDQATIARLTDATLAILERTGVRVAAPAALDVFAEAGAEVDRQTQIVRLSPELVENALRTAPRTFTLGARDARLDLPLGPGLGYMTTDGCGTEVIDRRTGQRRASTKADLAEITHLQDYLGSIAFWWPTVGAGDCGETAQVHEVEVGLDWTEKHLMGMVQGRRLAETAVEMARAVAGGSDELRRRPLLSDLIGTVSPLVHDRDATEAALVFAEAGVPVCFVTMPTLGTTAPATRPGAWAVGAAEIVSGAVLLQLAFPGAPVMGSIMQSHADPRTGTTVTWPLEENALPATVELVHAFGLPAFAGAGGTDAPRAGSWQAGSEIALGVFAGLLDGAEMMSGIGLVDTYRLSTPESLLLDDDLYHHVCDLMRAAEVTDEALALDAIDEVGPGGHFLAARHTRAHMKDAVLRGLAHQPADTGLGYRDPLDVARERTEAILTEYEPRRLPADLRAELAAVVAALDAEVRLR
jgi:trimethylamine--corrinoid protein Co-methyltransferase